ncbi:hypothetical protein [Candidatus Electronema sp. TJ]|uniref:hypothetical protein n=1 Tax=Candidatus Electronema sp. TJ TaxID=3401573 RepID=UPI003AA98235
MGWGYYSVDERAERAASVGYDTKSAREIFTQRNINQAMNPHGVVVRESRDSADHPNSVAIILALDVTGSMGSIPHHLVKDGLPKIMGRIIQSGTPDPQLLFLAVGDHECDSSPLQVGQFESSDELLDKWLTSVYLEGGGGGNAGESYLLAWYFAALHTSIDCFEKRRQKGFLFTIGDEPTLPEVPAQSLSRLMGQGQQQTWSAAELLDKARQLYHVFHLHIRETSSGSRQEVMDGWKQLMGGNLIILERHEEVSRVIPELIAATLRKDAAGRTATSAGPLPQTEVLL